MLKEEFITKSVETNLFYGRIMREHTVFIAAGLPQKNSQILMHLEKFRTQFDNLLSDVVTMSMGTVRKCVVDSGQLVSPDTYECERAVTRLTGIYINSQLTERTLTMLKKTDARVMPEAVNHYYDRCIASNKRALELAQGLKALKTDILGKVADGEILAPVYPSVLRHTVIEAEEYIKEIELIGRQDEISEEENTLFWVRRAAEHGAALEGMFDPSETMRKQQSGAFHALFTGIAAGGADSVTADESLKGFADFNYGLTDEILEHKIQALILPLFSDHLYRESRRGERC